LAIRNAAAEKIDWEKFLRLSGLHRVEGLIDEALNATRLEVPSKVAAELRKRTTELVRENLELTAEAVRLQRAFASNGIDVRFLKGITLAVLAYGNIGVRHGKDIDLLIEPSQANEAVRLLERCGYRRHDPPPELDDSVMQSLRPIRKDASFFHENRPFEVELHWRLLDNRHMMGAISPATPSQSVAVGSGFSLTTLGEKDLFAYLCAHGANHCWYRLKWLADIAALLGSADARKIEELFDGAVERGAGPAAAQALLLSLRLFALPLPDSLLQRFTRSARARWLERIGIWALTTGNEETVPTDLPFGATKITLSSYLLRSGVRYWLTELRIQFTSTRDMLMLPLPKPFLFLYPALHVPLWLCRRMMGRAH